MRNGIPLAHAVRHQGHASCGLPDAEGHAQGLRGCQRYAITAACLPAVAACERNRARGQPRRLCARPGARPADTSTLTGSRQSNHPIAGRAGRRHKRANRCHTHRSSSRCHTNRRSRWWPHVWSGAVEYPLARASARRAAAAREPTLTASGPSARFRRRQAPESRQAWPGARP